MSGNDHSGVSASLGEIDGKQKFHIYETATLSKGEAEPVFEFDFGIAVPEGFVFSPDGKYLFGSSFRALDTITW